ncbi:maltose 6'-phosphate phosphatase [Bacillus pakistanensis]|uniref:Maltose 6'-phosphate phosphatase n=1 Tax=Rossellomorea pakistanensis TaxID=992288 RepID=A0ABS2NJN1_9BACI|nr:endonuclease/exonuclease/phosphatase family protein [Bacillus pakistanensis]MBM7588073.1 maltose 6'-phosphate phosphatase [Bacillus pakistanensis]
MKLLTLNCHSWQEDNQMDKIKTLASVIAKKNYDVIALQEVSQLMERPIVKDPLREDNYCLILLDELKRLGVEDYELVWDFAHIGYDVYEEGVALLTKHPIVDTQSFFVSRSSDTSYWKTRKVIGVTISYFGNELSFYSCHLGWWKDDEEPFRSQVDALLSLIDLSKPAFLMGDFNNNASICDEGYDYLIGKELYDTYQLAEVKDKGITVEGDIAGWDENKQALRIDLILTNQSLKVGHSFVIFNGENEPVVSDHYGVEIEW